MLGNYYDDSAWWGGDWVIRYPLSLSCDFPGLLGEPVESGLKAKRRHYREYLARLAELRGEKAREVLKVQPQAKLVAVRYGARAREQRTRRRG